MNDKKELENKIKSIMQSSPVNPEIAKIAKNKYLREVCFYQDELTHNNVLIPFEIPLSEIEPEDSRSPVGVHGHTREIYCLRWEKLDNGPFAFTLENKLAKKKRKLVECPEEVIRDIYHLLPAVVEIMANKAEKILKEDSN